MKSIIATIAITLFFHYTFAQNDKLYEEMVASTVLLETQNGSGSGVFVDNNEKLFFVTARHVLFTNHGLIDQKATLTYYPHDVISDNALKLKIDLQKALADNMIKFDTLHDIAVVCIGVSFSLDTLGKSNKISFIQYKDFIEKNNTGYVNSWPSKGCPLYNQVLLGEPLYLFGFPQSIGIQHTPRFDYKRPLLRKGYVAGKYNNNKTIIIDCPVYFGNSGGPVFSVIHKNGYQETGLIGIVSEYIPYIDTWINPTTGLVNREASNSGYSTVASIEDAIKLMKLF